MKMDGGGSAIDVGAIDGGADAKRDAYVSVDSDPIECETLQGGQCAALVNSCAVCPASSYANPTHAGCSESYAWCCTNAAPSTNDCTSGGGVCVDSAAACPNQWTKVWTSCGAGSSSNCCMPDSAKCPVSPQKCADLGGVCTGARWQGCPAGMEIYALGDQLGCSSSMGGWCCVDAPPSSCADSKSGGRVCVPGKECTGCFAPVSDLSLTCEPGRSCCMDVCD